MQRSAVTRAFLDLADTLVDDYDVVQYVQLLMEHAVNLLDVSEAGVVVQGEDGQLCSVASSSERMHVMELVEVQHHDGPCYDCWATGATIVEGDLASAADRWPRFVPAALQVGFRAAAAVPMKLRDQRVGALNLFSDDVDRIPGPEQLELAQALADMATIGIVQQRQFSTHQGLVDQLQTALDSRIVVEQAKGAIAGRTGLGVDHAFLLLRDHARRQQRRLHAAALDVIAGRLTVDELTQGGPGRPTIDTSA